MELLFKNNANSERVFLIKIKILPQVISFSSILFSCNRTKVKIWKNSFYNLINLKNWLIAPHVESLLV